MLCQSQATQLARRIFGGAWNSGTSPYVYCGANATNFHVSFVEDKCIWLARNSAGLDGKINIDGFIEITGWKKGKIMIARIGLCSRNADHTKSVAPAVNLLFP